MRVDRRADECGPAAHGGILIRQEKSHVERRVGYYKSSLTLLDFLCVSLKYWISAPSESVESV